MVVSVKNVLVFQICNMGREGVLNLGKKSNVLAPRRSHCSEYRAVSQA
jgi:hypothetical protein